MENLLEIQDRRFPIGPFVKKDHYSAEELQSLTADIESAPENYRTLTENLNPNDLQKKYRDNSWNVQQLVHHVADIQLLHYFRMKKAITEPDYDVVTLIDMDQWVTTPDAKDAPIEDSLVMLEGITKRYVYLIKHLSEEKLQVTYFHPVRKFSINQAQAVAMTAWHVKHHLAHIKIALGNSEQ